MSWRLLPVRELSLRHWEDGWVVGDAISGDTHLLSHAAGLLVDRLRSGPATTAELSAALSQAGEHAETVQECLAALTSLELIEPYSV